MTRAENIEFTGEAAPHSSHTIYDVLLSVW